MKIALFIFFALFAGPLGADFYIAAKPKTFTSPNGEVLLRIEPPESYQSGLLWGGTVCRVFRLKGKAFEEVREFQVQGMAGKAFINDSADRIVFVDQAYGNRNPKPLLVVFDGEGKLLKQWGWKEMFGLEGLEALILGNEETENMKQSINSIFWWQRCLWIVGGSQFSILSSSVTPVLGGGEDGPLQKVFTVDMSTLELRAVKTEFHP